MKFFYSPKSIKETKEIINQIIERADKSVRLEMLYLVSLVQHNNELEKELTDSFGVTNETNEATDESSTRLSMLEDNLNALFERVDNQAESLLSVIAHDTVKAINKSLDSIESRLTDLEKQAYKARGIEARLNGLEQNTLGALADNTEATDLAFEKIDLILNGNTDKTNEVLKEIEFLKKHLTIVKD